MKMPGKSHKGTLPPLTQDQEHLRDRLRRHVSLLAGKIGERNLFHYTALQHAARYITGELQGLGLPVREQAYTVEGKEVLNLEVELTGTVHPEQILIIGAHYDSVSGSPGANDNASGVAALLELARIFKGTHTPRTVRFVAFVNEEPPWFQTEQMGSMVYAQRAKQRGEKIVGMLSLETIGYYSEAPDSQIYPAPFSLFYPSTGNFIAFVSDIRSRKLLRRAIGTFRTTTPFPSEGLAAPQSITGVGWSDQWSFWQHGYDGVMVTDTAPFRYLYYHQRDDTPEKLDYDGMSQVVSGLAQVVADLAAK